MKGFVAISTVIVLTVVVIGISITVSLLSINEGQSALTLFKGEENLSFAEGCSEDVLLKVRGNSTFNATSITRPEGTCSLTYNPGGSGPTNWDITVASSTTTYQRKIRVIFVRNATGITLTSWREM